MSPEGTGPIEKDRDVGVLASEKIALLHHDVQMPRVEEAGMLPQQ
jgi:hypothetical protein